MVFYFDSFFFALKNNCSLFYYLKTIIKKDLKNTNIKKVSFIKKIGVLKDF